jgi:hypothetical protein
VWLLLRCLTTPELLTRRPGEGGGGGVYKSVALCLRLTWHHCRVNISFVTGSSLYAPCGAVPHTNPPLADKDSTHTQTCRCFCPPSLSCGCAPQRQLDPHCVRGQQERGAAVRRAHCGAECAVVFWYEHHRGRPPHRVRPGGIQPRASESVLQVHVCYALHSVRFAMWWFCGWASGWCCAHLHAPLLLSHAPACC